jgi:hypothetical protein
MYSGTGNLVLIASPLSEIAYQMADNATGSLSDFAKVIEEKNDNVATAFGLDNIDVITTFPTDLTKTAAQNDNAGRFGLILSAISQRKCSNNINIIEAKGCCNIIIFLLNYFGKIR